MAIVAMRVCGAVPSRKESRCAGGRKGFEQSAVLFCSVSPTSPIGGGILAVCPPASQPTCLNDILRRFLSEEGTYSPTKVPRREHIPPYNCVGSCRIMNAQL